MPVYLADSLNGRAMKENVNGTAYVLGQDNDISEETIKALADGKYTNPEKK